MDEHDLIEFLVNRIRGMDRLADEASTIYALSCERGDSEAALAARLQRYARFDGQAEAYLDVLSQLVTFECRHILGCRCAAGHESWLEAVETADTSDDRSE